MPTTATSASDATILKNTVAIVRCNSYGASAPEAAPGNNVELDAACAPTAATPSVDAAETTPTPPSSTEADQHIPLAQAVTTVLDTIGYKPAYGSKILLKPNLLAPSENGLCCTHPSVVAAACDYITDHGAIPVVGDSPAFGSAMRVASNIGLDTLLEARNIQLITLEHPTSVTLPCGLAASISRHALETDAILNIPRLKAHSQFRITCGMKNLFGCVSGVRKALAHSKHGDKQNAFRSMLIEIHDVLPPVTSLLDGVIVMHRKGPSGGDPLPLGIIAASKNTVALDTATYMMVNASPEQLPLWQELRYRNHPAAFRSNLHFPLLPATDIDGSAFQFPQELKAESFHPAQLIRSAIKRFVMRYMQ